MTNPVAYAVESSSLIFESHNDYLVKWQLNLNMAFQALLMGKGEIDDLNAMAGALHLSASLLRLKKLADDGTLEVAERCIEAINDRRRAGNGTAMKSTEIQAVRDLIQLHDELLPVVTVREFEQALTIAKKDVVAGRAKLLKA